ncbi:MAG: hypothetical protein AB7F41_00685 [Methylocystis sp.]|uniref:hypothetical protein n=1 Tax=Methylocystis sp. TaxID=1911079 RepID=UPI003D10CAFD
MSWRRKLAGKPPERDPRPIYVAAFGLLMAAASYAIPDEGAAGALFGSGLITAAFCLVYWLANPTGGVE